MTNYDLAIIGSGPGGYVPAVYASRRKLKVCVIEKGLTGGTCLNRGCIPTKSLLNAASIISTIKRSAIYGIEADNCGIDFDKINSRKDEVILRLRAGIETLLKSNKIDLLRGAAVVTGANTVKIGGDNEIFAKNIIIAAGSKPATLDKIKSDEIDILTSDGILNLKAVPKSLAIIGGGVIGCEFASLYNILGSKVTIIEYTDRLVPGQSREVSKKLEMSFKKRGIDVFISTNAESVEKIAAEKILVSVGRKPNTDSLGDLAALGIKTEKSFIVVDENLRTGAGNIFAVGDCIRGPLLAHKASYDGIIAVDNILGGNRIPDYSNVPSCIWTEPEIASVGINEEDAKSKYQDVKISKFPYLGSGKACVMGRMEGFVKIIGNKNGEILGVEIFGEGACDLIAEAVLAKTAGVRIEEWGRVVHGHPTLSEMFGEAAEVFRA